MTDGLVAALREIVGDAWLDTGGDAGLPPVDGVRPALRVSPGDAEEVASLLQLCAEHEAAVIPTGSGSALDLGNVPSGADVLLSTSRLDQILQYTPADMTVSVQAGASLAGLQAELATHGQFLPIDPPNAGRATIGGVVATAASGPRRTGYGAVRDLLIGIRMAHPDGQTTRAGGMVVKNVTGYDMGKLYTGSLGTLGVIVEANFKLLPFPADEQTAVGLFGDAPGCSRALDALVDSVLMPNSVEILDSAAATAVLGDNSAAARAILIRFGGRPEAVDRQVGDARSIFEECGAGVLTLAGDDQLHAWQALAELSDAPSAGPAVRCRVSVLSSQVELVFAHAEAVAAAAGLSLAIWGRAFDGVINVTLAGDGDQRLTAAIESLRAEVTTLPGSLIVEACPLGVKRQTDVWGPGADPGAVEIMRSIKAKFDPRGVLNPGRFAHGI